jgi:AAA+ ATPase superfamily predicted ATPase
MMKFVGRDREIKKLNTLYQDEGFQSLCRDLQTI